MKAPVLNTHRLVLEPLSQKHISESYVNWMNNSLVIKYLESGGDYNLEKLTQYIEDVEKKDIFFWAILIRESNQHIGNIKIDPIQQKHGLGEYAIMMGETLSWGKGFAKEASLKVIDYVFSELSLRKITLGVVKENESAVKLYQKLGFVIEGTYKKHGFYNGTYCDVYRMAIFNENQN